jgi:hypothetical protein
MGQMVDFLKPSHTFKVDTGQDWKQTFGLIPQKRGGLKLVVITKKGQRDVGQWVFNTVIEAENFARNRVLCNGPFDV